MANFYCDISAIGAANEYQAYAATPTLGALATDRPRPMDGNGKAQNAVAAAVAIAELQITTLPTDGQTLSIGGSAAITAKTTVAAKNQFAIGASIATATTNLTALINTFGTTSNTCDVAAVAAVSQALLAIPYLYYARVKPGTTDTIQLFTRIAGAGFNTASNSTSKVTQTGTWLNSGAASINFTEGVDGPFGYFVSGQAVFGGNIGVHGIYTRKSPASTEPGAADVIFVRAARSGSPLTCSVSASGTNTLIASVIGTRNYVFDNLGATWASDVGVFTLFIEQLASANTGIQSGSNAAKTTFVATEKDGFVLLLKPNASYPAAYYGGNGGEMVFYKCKFDVHPSVASYASAIYAGQVNCRVSYIDCRIIMRKQQVFFTMNGNYDFYMKFIGGSIEYYGIGSHVNALFSAGGSPSTPFEILLDNMAVTIDGGVGGYGVNSVVSNGANITTGNVCSLSVIDCTGFNSPSIGLPAGTTYPGGFTFIWQDTKTGTFRRERMNFTSEFAPNSVYPTLDITDRTGVPIACRVSWEAARLVDFWVLEAARFTTQYRGGDAINTCELELITPSVAVPHDAQISMSLTYISSDGVRRNETNTAHRLAPLVGTTTNLPVGVGLGAWTLNGVTGVESRKLSIRTAYPIKQNTVVAAKFLLTGPPASGTYSIYISPNIRFTL